MLINVELFFRGKISSIAGRNCSACLIFDCLPKAHTIVYVFDIFATFVVFFVQVCLCAGVYMCRCVLVVQVYIVYMDFRIN